MINATNGQLVFCKSGDALNADVRDAARGAANALLKLLGREGLDLATVTTKTNLRAAYAKFMLTHTLNQDVRFDEGYVQGAWEFYNAPGESITAHQFYSLTLGMPDTEFAFKRSYVKAFRGGVGLFFLALHSRGAVTLPMRFELPPTLGDAGRASEDLGIFAELLGFVRLLGRDSVELPHPAFDSVGTSRKRREWFLSYGTKLLLATGWLTPSDARIEDLVALKAAEPSLGMPGEVIAYKGLIDVLRARYGEEFNITVNAWTSVLRSPKVVARRAELKSGIQLEDKGERRERNDDADLLSEVLKASPAMASAQALRTRPRLPGLTTELSVLADKWLELEEVYTRTVKRESYKPVHNALGYLNIYLFFYLAYWFQRHCNTRFAFPDTPQKLTGSIFVARLLTAEDETPLTFIEFMNAVNEHRKWTNNGYYGILKQVNVFFSFLEVHSDDLPACAGFRQTIPDFAYPETTRSKGTNKLPIPRRMFGVFLDYVEALRAYSAVVLDGAVAGALDVAAFEKIASRTGNVIDTFATASLVGFIPVLFARGRTIPLQYIPNCLSFGWFPLAGGRVAKLPQPHALNQIVVALYTGLRHNHIQWLDARSFDAKVTDDNKDFALLLVNTDKSMRKPWTPHVNFRVIEVLRSQHEWRKTVQVPGLRCCVTTTTTPLQSGLPSCRSSRRTSAVDLTRISAMRASGKTSCVP
jgi:hypothetical protein